LLQRLVAEEALDRVDADRVVDLGAIAHAFARVVADSSHDRRERVVAGEMAPRRLVVAAFGVKSQPWMSSPAGHCALQGGMRST
jgi:hypothetical protein